MSNDRRTKLTDEQVLTIYTSKLSTDVLTDIYKVSRRTINDIRNGRSRKDITRGYKSSFSTELKDKLTIDDIKEIYLSIEDIDTLARRYEISRSMIRKIWDGIWGGDITRELVVVLR